MIKSPKEPVAGRRVAEGSAFLRGDPYRDELLDQPAVGREHAERPVPGTGEIDGQLDDAEEHRVERKLRGARIMPASISRRSPSLASPPSMARA